MHFIINLPSVYRLMNELGREQVTRLIAHTLWDMRGGKENNPRDWYDAERINSDPFWDDLQGMIRGDRNAAERALQHVFFYGEELQRVVQLPEQAPVELKLQLRGLKPDSGAGQPGYLLPDYLLQLLIQSAIITFGPESSMQIQAPLQISAEDFVVAFRSAESLSGKEAVSNIQVEPEKTVFTGKAPATATRKEKLQISTGGSGNSAKPAKALLSLESVELLFDIAGTLTIGIDPVQGYPIIPGLAKKSNSVTIRDTVRASLETAITDATQEQANSAG